MKLDSVRLENVGGFRTTEFPTKTHRLLVGENNSGKTSILRVLNWIFNELDSDLLYGRRPLSAAEASLLVPARETRNSARRIFLRIPITDRRSWSRLNVTNGFAEVRVQFRSDRVFAKVFSPTRGEGVASDSAAVEMVQKLQKSYCVEYVNASRDGSSSFFEDGMLSALKSRFAEDFINRGPGRGKTLTQQIRTITTDLNSHGPSSAQQLWKEMQVHLHGVFDPSVQFRLNLTAESLVGWLADNTSAQFSTGSHDEGHVGVTRLGSGMQSLLGIALVQMTLANSPSRILLLEEPEAFLHPSAQRSLASEILSPSNFQVIATTHSPTVLAEANPASVTVMRNHIAFPAADRTEIENSKDQFLLTSNAAFALFDRSILLVEGPGDVAFFEGLRRRMRDILPGAVVDRLRVVSVGGKQGFGPWLRLLRRFHDHASGDYAFDYLVAADSIDAVADIVRAFKESSVPVPLDLKTALDAISQQPGVQTAGHINSVHSATTEANRLAEEKSFPFHWLPVDLEYCILQPVSESRCKELAGLVGIEFSSKMEMLSHIGSKGGSNKAGDNAKAPYIRGLLAEDVDWNEIGSDVKDLLWRWVVPALKDPQTSRPAELS